GQMLNRPSGAKAFAPPGQARWGRDTECAHILVQKPSLHRGEPGGGEVRFVLRLWCRSLRSTGASPVGTSANRLRRDDVSLADQPEVNSNCTSGVRPASSTGSSTSGAASLPVSRS